MEGERKRMRTEGRAAQRGRRSFGGRKAADRKVRARSGGKRHRRAEEGPGRERPGLEVERT